jgi:hemerythrin-like metal-binding protein
MGTQMVVIRWSDAMSVGVPRLDRDHRVLIGLVNRLEGERSRRPDEEVIGEVLEALVAFAVFHFAREEYVMETCGVAEIETHREEHKLLTAEVAGLHARFLGDRRSVLPDALMRFLTDWLNHHILLQDFAYRDALGGGLDAERVARAFGEFDVESVAGPVALGDLIDAD